MPDQPPRPPLSRARIAEIREHCEYRRDYSETARMALEALAELDRRDALAPTARTLARNLRSIAKHEHNHRGEVELANILRSTADLLDAFLAGSRADTEE